MILCLYSYALLSPPYPHSLLLFHPLPRPPSSNAPAVASETPPERGERKQGDTMVKHSAGEGLAYVLIHQCKARKAHVIVCSVKGAPCAFRLGFITILPVPHQHTKGLVCYMPTVYCQGFPWVFRGLRCCKDTLFMRTLLLLFILVLI